MNTILSIVIVTYNNEHEIGECIDSIFQYFQIHPFELILVDNGSRDCTVTEIQKRKTEIAKTSSVFRFIRNPENLGYTRAVNTGLQEANGRFVLLLNPDCVITEGSIESLLQFVSNHPDAGAAAPQLLNPDGSIQPSCRRFPRYRYILFETLGLSRVFSKNSVFNGWKMGDFDHQSLQPVDQPQGACLMLSLELLQQIGSLDNRFFMFFSDVDFCRRIWQSDRKIYFYPDAKIIHKKGSSVYRNHAAMITLSHRDFIRYFLKWYCKPWQLIWNAAGIPFLILIGVVRWGFCKIKS